MPDLSGKVKSKIEGYSKENLAQAKNKASEASFLVQKASASRNMELISQAIKLYLEAIDLYPRYTEPYIAVAYISWQMGNYDYAVKLLNNALDIESFNTKAREMLNNIKEQLQRERISAVLKKQANLSLSEKIKPEGKVKTDIFFNILKVINFKPQKKNTSGAAITNTAPETDHDRNLQAMQQNSVKRDDFYAVLNESRKNQEHHKH
jgi:tetratricopeptide (TPR) repeat protein